MQWLARHLPAAARIAVASNAEARAHGRRRAGRRGHRRRGRRGDLRLDVLAAHIEDEPNNTTRFWVLGRHGASAIRSSDETSLVMSAHNRPGAVHALLEPLRASTASA